MHYTRKTLVFNIVKKYKKLMDKNAHILYLKDLK